MAITLTEQWRVWPAGGGEIEYLVDGEGMHASVAFDLVRQLNNIGSYVCNWGQFVYNSDTGTDIAIDPGETGEYFVFQMPIVIPRGAVRMFWTAGLSNGGDYTLTYAKVYVADIPYALDPSLAFNAASFLTASVRSDRVDQTVSTSAYALFGGTSTGVTAVDGVGGSAPSNTGWAQIAYLIFCVRVNSVGGSPTPITMRDFTCWFKYE